MQQAASVPAVPGKQAAQPLSAEALDFVPGLLAIQESPPARLPRVVMYLVVLLCAILIAWAIFGKLDIVASCEGKLVPQSYVKIVQPADAGIVQEILVREGEHVVAGQVLMRMDTREARADESTLKTEVVLTSLQLRRIDAELGNVPLARQAGDPDDLYRHVDAQFQERRGNYRHAVGEAEQTHTRSMRDYDAGREVLAKLREVTPLLKEQAQAYDDMAKQGYVPVVTMRDKQRDYLEKARDLQAQESTVAGLAASVAAAATQIEQVTSKYRSDLRNERMDAEEKYRKFGQDLLKQQHKSGLLELRAPETGVVQDLATHTAGTVVSPGSVLLSLVPDREALVAEVMVKNDDVGFTYPHQRVKLKLAAYPFQQYGMIDGQIVTIGSDASNGDAAAQASRQGAKNDPSSSAPAQFYKALVSLDSQQLAVDGKRYKLVAGMQVVAEVNEGRRTVLEYLLAPLQKTVLESGRER